MLGLDVLDGSAVAVAVGPSLLGCESLPGSLV